MKDKKKTVLRFVSAMIYFAATALWTYISYKENEKLLMIVATIFFIKGIIDIVVGIKNVISQV